MNAGTNKRIWLRAFWGFSPEHEGYYGFTRKKTRETFIELSRPGDWVLIYGAVNPETAPDQVRQALGFLEITHDTCMDVDRMSEEAIQRRDAGSYADRWNYGIQVSRAWRITKNVHIRNIAVGSYSQNLRFPRATMGVLLDSTETERALSYPVNAVPVFGESAVLEDAATLQAEKVFRPSKGIPPTFGTKEVVTEDGENYLYLMSFTGPLSMILPDLGKNSDLMLFKVGRSNSPKLRLAQLNSSFPKSSATKWDLMLTHSFPNGADAHKAEQNLILSMDRKFKSLGNEFFSGEKAEIQSLFLNHCLENSIIIKGAPGKPMK